MCRCQHTWAKKPFLERRAYRKRFHIRATNCCLLRLQPFTWYDPLPSVQFNQSVSLHSDRSHDTQVTWHTIKLLLMHSSFAKARTETLTFAWLRRQLFKVWETVCMFVCDWRKLSRKFVCVCCLFVTKKLIVVFTGISIRLIAFIVVVLC